MTCFYIRVCVCLYWRLNLKFKGCKYFTFPMLSFILVCLLQVTVCTLWETADEHQKVSRCGSRIVFCLTSTETNSTSSVLRNSGRMKSMKIWVFAVFNMKVWIAKTDHILVFVCLLYWLFSIGCALWHFFFTAVKGLPLVITTSVPMRRITPHLAVSITTNCSVCRSMRSYRWRRWWGRAVYWTCIPTARVRRSHTQQTQHLNINMTWEVHLYSKSAMTFWGIWKSHGFRSTATYIRVCFLAFAFYIWCRSAERCKGTRCLHLWLPTG